MRIFSDNAVLQKINVFTAFYPVYVFGWLLGVVPFKFKSTTRKRTVVRTTYGIYTYLVMNVLVFSYVCLMIEATKFYFVDNSIFQIYFGMYYLFFSTMLSLSVIITKIVNQKQFEELWKMIIQSDETIEEISGIPINDSCSCLLSIAEIIISNFLLLRSYYYTLLYLDNTTEMKSLILCTIAGNIYKEYIKVEFELWMILIATRFGVLNKVLIVSTC